LREEVCEIDAWNSSILESSNVSALRATIFCAHRLSNWTDLGKIIRILLNNLQVEENLDAIDEDGNTFLHWTSMARGTDFLLSDDCPLLPFLLANLSTALLTRNKQGKVPLHLALESCKEWTLIHNLLVACPQAAGIPLPPSEHQNEQLPLHMMISKRNDAVFNKVEENMEMPREDQKVSVPLHHSVATRKKCSLFYTVEEIIEMWKAFPEAALIVDPFTGLLPFQLAATVFDTTFEKLCTKNNKGKKSNNKSRPSTDMILEHDRVNERHMVSTIYALLHVAPEALRLFD
jgi:hypothetical protein